jgi:hypothetical protein
MTTQRAAWVIIWDWSAETRKPKRQLIHIRQPRWKISRVLEHMKFLYLNSELFTVAERLPFLTRKPWDGLVFMEGPRIIIGDNPILVGSWVHDLRIERVRAGEEVVRWTQPAGIRFRRGTRDREYLGRPTERAFRVLLRGEVEELPTKT